MGVFWAHECRTPPVTERVLDRWISDRSSVVPPTEGSVAEDAWTRQDLWTSTCGEFDRCALAGPRTEQFDFERTERSATCKPRITSLKNGAYNLHLDLKLVALGRALRSLFY